MGLVVKYRQLARHVGEFTDNPLVNLLAILNSTIVLEEGTIFIFGSWTCIANGFGGFTSHLAKPEESEALALVHVDGAHKLAGNLDKLCLSDLIKNYLNELKAIPRPKIGNDDLIKEHLVQHH